MKTKIKKMKAQMKKTVYSNPGFERKAVAGFMAAFFIFYGIPVPTSFAGDNNNSMIVLNENRQLTPTLTLEQANLNQTNRVTLPLPSGVAIQDPNPLSLSQTASLQSGGNPSPASVSVMGPLQGAAVSLPSWIEDHPVSYAYNSMLGFGGIVSNKTLSLHLTGSGNNVEITDNGNTYAGHYKYDADTQTVTVTVTKHDIPNQPGAKEALTYTLVLGTSSVIQVTKLSETTYPLAGGGQVEYQWFVTVDYNSDGTIQKSQSTQKQKTGNNWVTNNTTTGTFIYVNGVPKLKTGDSITYQTDGSLVENVYLVDYAADGSIAQKVSLFQSVNPNPTVPGAITESITVDDRTAEYRGFRQICWIESKGKDVFDTLKNGDIATAIAYFDTYPLAQGGWRYYSDRTLWFIRDANGNDLPQYYTAGAGANERSYIVVGEMDAVPGQGDDIYLARNNRVTVDGKDYAVEFTTDYAAVDGMLVRYAWKLYFRGTDETIKVDYPETGTVEISGKTYQITIDGQGIVNLNEVILQLQQAAPVVSVPDWIWDQPIQYAYNSSLAGGSLVTSRTLTLSLSGNKVDVAEGGVTYQGHYKYDADTRTLVITIPPQEQENSPGTTFATTYTLQLGEVSVLRLEKLVETTYGTAASGVPTHYRSNTVVEFNADGTVRGSKQECTRKYEGEWVFQSSSEGTFVTINGQAKLQTSYSLRNNSHPGDDGSRVEHVYFFEYAADGSLWQQANLFRFQDTKPSTVQDPIRESLTLGTFSGGVRQYSQIGWVNSLGHSVFDDLKNTDFETVKAYLDARPQQQTGWIYDNGRTIHFIRDAAGTLIPQFYMGSGADQKSYIVQGDVDAVPGQGDDIYLANNNRVTVDGQDYSVGYDADYSIGTDGLMLRHPWKLIFRPIGSGETIKVDYPEVDTIEISGKTYQITIDEAGVVHLEEQVLALALTVVVPLLSVSTTQVTDVIVKDPSNGRTMGAGFTITNTGTGAAGFQLYRNDDATYTSPDGTVSSISGMGVGFYFSSGGLSNGGTITIPTYINNNLAPGIYRGTYQVQAILSGGGGFPTVTTVSYEIEVLQNALVPVTEGWTRVPSNANFAYQTIHSDPGNPMAGTTTLQVMDLLTGHVYVLDAVTASQKDFYGYPTITTNGKAVVYLERKADGGFDVCLQLLQDGAVKQTVAINAVPADKPNLIHFSGSEVLVETINPTFTHHIDLTPLMPLLSVSATQVHDVIVKDASNWMTQGTGFTLSNSNYSHVGGFQLSRNNDATYTAPDGTISTTGAQGAGFYLSSGGLSNGGTITVPTYINNNLAPGIYRGTYRVQAILSDGSGFPTVTTVSYEIEVKNPPPPLPAGWTRAASNENFAYSIRQVDPHATSASSPALVVMDLRTGIEKVMTYENPGYSLQNIDISPEETAAGPVVIYETVISGVLDPQVTLVRFADTAQRLTIKASLTERSFLTDGSLFVQSVEYLQNFTIARLHTKAELASGTLEKDYDIDLAELQIAVPAGWTRAASNANYAFTEVYERVGQYTSYTLKLQDLRTGQIQVIATRMMPYGGYTGTYDVSPDGTTVIYGKSGPVSPQPVSYTVILQRIDDPTKQLILNGELQSIAFEQNGTVAVLKIRSSAATDGQTRRFDLGTFQEVLPAGEFRAGGCLVADQGTGAASSACVGIAGTANGTVEIHSYKQRGNTGIEIYSGTTKIFSYSIASLQGTITQANISPDGKYLVVYNQFNRVTVVALSGASSQHQIVIPDNGKAGVPSIKKVGFTSATLIEGTFKDGSAQQTFKIEVNADGTLSLKNASLNGWALTKGNNQFVYRITHVGLPGVYLTQTIEVMDLATGKVVRLKTVTSNPFGGYGFSGVPAVSADGTKITITGTSGWYNWAWRGTWKEVYSPVTGKKIG